MAEINFRNSCVAGKNKNIGKKKRNVETSSRTSRISITDMERILEQLKKKQHRDSTAKTYLSTWKQFNNFVISLDRKPRLWEDRAMLFIA